MRSAALALALVAIPLSALGAKAEISEAQRAQMETLRAEIAAQIQLQAFDLLDELVYGWTQRPVFELETPVVLADVTSPVGFGTGLDALIENHFASLVVKNPRGGVVLAHCPQCTATVVHSGAKGTIVSRGVDNPEALAQMGALSGAKHALFLDFEVEGAALVLRARITSLEPALPIVYARTLSTSTSSPALLRTGDRLKSAEEARQEYVDALQGRGAFIVPMRIGVRSYATNEDQFFGAIRVPPMVWLQIGAEVGLTQARAWTASLSIGGSWAPESHTGLLAQGRISRLLSGSATSLTRPDLYGFIGGSIIGVFGPGALAFYDENEPLPNPTEDPDALDDAQAIFAAVQVGLELRVKNRIGVSLYVENHPAFVNPRSISNYLDFGIITFQSIGAEVTFCF